MSQWITIKEAAASLGISSSTLKRVCDSNSILLDRSPGGHRRIDRPTFQLVENAVLRSGVRQQSRLHEVVSLEFCLERLLANKPRELASAIMSSAGSLDSLVETIENSLVVALWRVGEQCAGQQIDVFESCIAANTASVTLDYLYELVAGTVPVHHVAVGGCLAPGYDIIPSKLVAIALSTIGFRAVDLGALVPTEVLAKAAMKLNAHIVWTTNTHVSDPQQTVLRHQSLKEQLPDGVDVLIGGGGISPSVRRSLAWCRYFETCSQLVDTCWDRSRTSNASKPDT